MKMKTSNNKIKMNLGIEGEIQSSPFSSLSINSAVVYTSTNGCCLRWVSLDQIEALIDNASARYGESFGSSGKDFIASISKDSYSEDLKKFIELSTSDILISNSCSESPDLNMQSALYFSSSDLAYSVVENSALREKNKYDAAEPGFIRENKMLLSITKSVLTAHSNSSSFFSEGILLSNSSLTLGEISASNLLNEPFFAFLPNSTDHLMNSCSSFVLSLPRICSSLSLNNRFSLATSDQFTHGNFSSLDFNSSSTANVTLAIYTSPLRLSSSNFSSSSTFLVMPLRTTSAQFISGCDFLNRSNNSSGTDTVILGIFGSSINTIIYVNASKYVGIYKGFGFVPENLGKNLNAQKNEQMPRKMNK